MASQMATLHIWVVVTTAPEVGVIIKQNRRLIQVLWSCVSQSGTLNGYYVANDQVHNLDKWMIDDSHAEQYGARLCEIP